MTREQLIEQTIDSILAREGGFVHRAEDRGGPTKFGITMETLSAWRRQPVSLGEIQTLQVAEARAIYRSQYIEGPGFLAIQDPAIFDLVVDSAVNHGPGRAIRFLQTALGIEPDGEIGPITRAAIAAMPPAWLYRKALAERVRFYGRLISKDLTDADRDGMTDSAEFAAGWLNRAATFIERMN